MRKEDLYYGISGIKPAYLEEADTCRAGKRSQWRRWAAAGFCLFCGVGFPVLASADNGILYELLYAVSPEIAQKLKPINVSCEDKGIKMQVIGAEVKGDKAGVLVSVQDTEGNRIDETTDLFDSYSIHTPYDQTGGCFFIEYDEEAQAAIFMLEIKQMDQLLIPGDKITFSVREIRSGKKHSVSELEGVDLKKVSVIDQFKKNPNVRGFSGDEADPEKWKDLKFMEPDEERGVILEEGVALTGYGLEEDGLHIQIRFEDVLETDNHGLLYLKNQKGERIDYQYHSAFWDESGKDSYEEYVFEVSPGELSEYEVWGEFWICHADPIKGNWQVTFPIEN